MSGQEKALSAEERAEAKVAFERVHRALHRCWTAAVPPEANYVKANWRELEAAIYSLRDTLTQQRDEHAEAARREVERLNKERADIQGSIDLVNALNDKRRRDACFEPGCDEPAPPYCARHRGDWITRNDAVAQLRAEVERLRRALTRTQRALSQCHRFGWATDADGAIAAADAALAPVPAGEGERKR